MADEPSNGNGAQLGLADVVEMLRDDAAAAELRGNRSRDELETRLMTAIHDVSSDLGRYVEHHGGEHVAIRTTEEVAHARYDAFIAANALDQARRDGALGIVRFVADALGRNWKAVAFVAAGIAAATGSIHLSIGLQ